MSYNHNITTKLFELAKEVSPVRGARICAAVVYKGKIISIGVNSYKTHPRAKKLNNDLRSCTHAEMAAIFQAQNTTGVDFSKCDIYVIRAKQENIHKFITNDNWVYGISKPCSGCMKLIESMKFKDVYCLTKDYDNFQNLNLPR